MREALRQGLEDFIADLELVDEVGVPPHIERRYFMRIERSAKNGAEAE
jgi:hypothetical protein